MKLIYCLAILSEMEDVLGDKKVRIQLVDQAQRLHNLLRSKTTNPIYDLLHTFDDLGSYEVVQIKYYKRSKTYCFIVTNPSLD